MTVNSEPAASVSRIRLPVTTISSSVAVPAVIGVGEPVDSTCAKATLDRPRTSPSPALQQRIPLSAIDLAFRWFSAGR